jgi:hypothetical protein
MSLLDTASLIVTPNGYKEGKLYSVIPSDGSGDMSVVRATTATRVNSAGLIELVPYNLFTYSEAFSNAAWVKSNATFSVDTLTGNAGTSFKGIFQNQTTQGVQSVFFDVAYSSHQWIQIAVGTTASDVGYVNFDIQNKVVGAQTGGFTGSIVDFGTYVRIIANINTIAKTSVLLCLVNSSSSSRASTTTSTGSIKLYRSQLIEGSVVKDYQKTETRLNIPRLDYSNGTCPSLLVEPQRTNLLTYSSSFDNAAWNNSASVTANAVISPSGIQDADRVTGILSQLEAFTSGQSYTLSFYAKKNTSSSFAMRLDATANNTFTYNFDTETASSGATIEEFGNGWYYCTALVTANATATGVVYLNVNSDDFYLWGAQLEVGNYGTSYIPTTSASVTRNADVISKTGISSLIGQTEGTMFVEFINDNNNNASIARVIALSDGTANNRLYLAKLLSGASYFVSVTSGTQTGAITGAIMPQGIVKIALAYNANDVVMYVNGSLVGSDLFHTTPATSNLYLGQENLGTASLCKPYNAVALWQTRLTNDELATLTTI